MALYELSDEQVAEAKRRILAGNPTKISDSLLAALSSPAPIGKALEVIDRMKEREWAEQHPITLEPCQIKVGVMYADGWIGRYNFGQVNEFTLESALVALAAEVSDGR